MDPTFCTSTLTFTTDDVSKELDSKITVNKDAQTLTLTQFDDKLDLSQGDDKLSKQWTVNVNFKVFSAFDKVTPVETVTQSFKYTIENPCVKAGYVLITAAPKLVAKTLVVSNAEKWSPYDGL